MRVFVRIWFKKVPISLSYKTQTNIDGTLMYPGINYCETQDFKVLGVECILMALWVWLTGLACRGQGVARGGRGDLF